MKHSSTPVRTQMPGRLTTGKKSGSSIPLKLYEPMKVKTPKKTTFDR